LNSEFALAVHCLVLLAFHSKEMLTSSAIAESISVHPVRIRKILSLLKKAGYIDSKEGAKGGVSINCDPKDITLDKIYRLTQKNVLKPKCHECHKECIVGANIEDVLDNIFYYADQELQQFLKKYTLDMILDKLKK